jgi:ligand-binding sensor domain-containing protein/two-component sensor histidine kinase
MGGRLHLGSRLYNAASVIANVAWLLLLALPASAAYVSRIWRTQDGLPENRVRALAQTPDGYLWIGTTGGLARFDGVRFVVYTRFNTPAITEDNMRALTVARDGSLWVATDGGGLLHVKDGNFRAFGPKEGLTTDFVASVLEDRAGYIWAATNRGLFRGTNGRFTRLDTHLQLRNQAFFSLSETPDGAVLAGSQAGLFRIKGGALQLPPGEPIEVFRLRQTRAGSLWMSTNHGVRAIGATADLAPLQERAIGAISEDHAGNVWVGTIGAGVYLYRAGQRHAEHLAETLPDATVLSILEDREAGVWLGTADGLVRLTAPDIRVIDRRHGLENENISTVSCMQNGGVWLTTVTGGVYRYTNGAVQPFRLPAPADSVRTLGVFEDSAGARWFGSDSQGAVRLVNGIATRFTMREGLRNNGIQFFHPGRDGTLWIGTTSGISRWNGTRFRNYYIEDGLSYGWVRSVADDANGDILIGTDRGINRVRDGRFIADDAFAQLSRDKVWSIFRDAQNTLWLGTRSSGLVRVRGREVKRITTKEGLLSNAIFQVLGAGDDRLWMSGPIGISSASLADLNAAADGRTGGALSYRIGGGPESAQVNGGVQNSGCVAANGEIWFPSVKGAIHFKSRRPPIRRHMPVRIEAVLVDDQPLPPSNTIPPGRHRVRIEFTSNSLRAPEGVTFRYKLDRFDSQWVLATGPRTAEYDNLPPGQYRFLVAAHDESPGDNTSQAGFAFTLEPYFYQTGWFYALIVAGAAAGVAGIFLYRERRTRHAYALRLAERTRIAREMHDTLVQGCVGVSTLIEAAVGSARSDQDQMLECLDNARVHLRLTIDEARQALTDLRHDSFEAGLPGALQELTRSIKSPPVTLQVEGEPVPLPDVTNRALLLVTREAIRNAVTHGAPGSIEVSLLYGRSVLELDIQDNGRGFAPPETELANVGHFGVLGMRERMEQIGGTLEVASAPGAGTAVSARLPL